MIISCHISPQIKLTRNVKSLFALIAVDFGQILANILQPQTT
ncbi:hypothetical protein [Helicobacter sp. MIT 01-3238]|nr:hypothetical protein [Helicobacter sp. MIT 01-3238]